ncbi:hypothetical protein [Streptomyces puniciscabiei]|uniref:hypothetical protein n=1 Tax=Streptomyces puniciscabiei TaxID=164348 RepID=UPI003321D533
MGELLGEDAQHDRITVAAAEEHAIAQPALLDKTQPPAGRLARRQPSWKVAWTG